MKRQAITIGIMTIALIAIWNGWLLMGWNNANLSKSSPWREVSRTNDARASRPEPKLWRDIKKTSVDEAPNGDLEPTFDDSVTAAEGARVELPGVGFLLSSGVRANKEGKEEVTEFLLLPADGGVAWCCGLTPIPRFEFSVLVECPDAPFLTSKADPKSSALFVSVEGTLRLQKDNSISSLYTLEEATIEFIDIAEVAPPNVMNMCRNQPMTRELEKRNEHEAETE